ncbi:MAG: bifunctional phosphopantothenoylcysteine decarboxylase/phosphopantothenate--cysteine ligase CoaBC [Thiotrichales bacterium]
MALENQKILLGVTGGIAAYKSAELTRLLMKAGAEVRVVMTDSAQQFFSATTLQALSGQPVRTDLFDMAHEAAMGHIELARWPDRVLVAPASANSLARIAHGLADDLLSTLVLATDRPVTVAPAMNHLMWSNAATQRNIAVLHELGIQILGPASGEQACGESGPGRMLEPADILDALAQPANAGKLAGKSLLITAGPTHEPIDPVRFLGNRSSGKMGAAIAQAAASQGASVTLVHGPMTEKPPAGIQNIPVETAEEMLAAVKKLAGKADIFIATAAVADYRVAEVATRKIKKTADEFSLKLTRNPDILATISQEFPQLFTVGFAAETEQLAQNAKEKLARKNLNMIAANPVDGGRAFGREDNELQVYWKDGEQHFPRASKTVLAQELINLIAEQYDRQLAQP